MHICVCVCVCVCGLFSALSLPTVRSYYLNSSEILVEIFTLVFFHRRRSKTTTVKDRIPKRTSF